MFRAVMFGSVAAFLLGFAGLIGTSRRRPTLQSSIFRTQTLWDLTFSQCRPDRILTCGLPPTRLRERQNRFRIELGASQPLDDKESKQFDIQSGHGKLVAEPGSDASILLNDLKKALEAKTLPTKVQRANTLPVNFVSFGSHQSQAPGGGFNAKPPAIGHR